MYRQRRHTGRSHRSATDANELCRKVSALFSNQGADVETNVPADAKFVVDYMTEVSEPYGTKFQVGPEEVSVVLANEPSMKYCA